MKLMWTVRKSPKNSASSNIQSEIFSDALNWTKVELIRWIADKNLADDLKRSDILEYTRRCLENIMETQKISLAELVRVRFVIAQALKNRINECRNNTSQEGLLAFKENFCVTPKVSMAFKPQCYPAKNFYSGRVQFQKHFYSAIGDMDSEPEIRCAQYIDAHSNVETWVRNIPRDPFNSFWIATHSGKFYPDFVVKLKNGISAVVEYKGDMLVETSDTKEKQMLGEIWANESGGQCRFLMAVERDSQGRDLFSQIQSFLA